MRACLGTMVCLGTMMCVGQSGRGGACPLEGLTELKKESRHTPVCPRSRGPPRNGEEPNN